MGFVIGLFAACVIFFIAFFIFSKMRYKTKYNAEYNVKNMFPYELNFKAKLQDNLLGNIFLVLYGACALAFFALASQKSLLPYSNVIILVASILYIVINLSLVFVPLELVKLHLGVSIFSMVFTFTFFGAISYVCFDYYQHFQEVPYLVLGIIGIIFCLFYFGVSMNPKLNAPLNYEEVKNEDGSITYKRPKFFVLAFSEWLCIFANLLAITIALVLYLL